MSFAIRIFTLLSLFALSGIISGQSITGKVITINAEPVAYANVAVYDEDRLLSGAATDSVGNFVVNYSEGKDTLRVSVSALGYITFDTTVLVETESRITLGDLVLPAGEGVELVTAEVTATRPQVQRLADRVNFIPGNSPLVAGKALSSFFRLLPGVFMDASGNVSINGRGGTRIMLNGVIQRMSGPELRQLLDGIQAEDIEKIEIIAIPGAEYSAEGGRGLINIVTKRRTVQGLTSRLTGTVQQGRYPYYSLGTFNALKTNKATFYLNAYLFNDQSFTDQTVIQKTNGSATVTRQEVKDVNNVENNQIRAGAVFDLSEDQRLGLEYVRTSNQKSISSQGKLFASDGSMSEFDIPYSGDHVYQNVSLNYQWRLDTNGRILSIISDYTDKAFEGTYEFGTLGEESNAQLLLPDDTKMLAAQADLLAVVPGLNTGVKLNTTTRNNSFTRRIRDEGSVWQMDGEGTQKFDYEEYIYAAYFTYERAIGKLSAKIGLRAEGTGQRGNSVTETADFSNDFFGIYPSVFLSGPIGKSGNHDWRMAFSRGLGRPNFEVLNPYRYQIDPIFIRQGNPNLRPSTTLSYSVGATIAKRFDVSMFYDVVDKEIGELFIEDGPLTIITQENLNEGKEYGISFYLPLINTEKTNLTSTVMAFGTEYTFSDMRRSEQTFYTQMNARQKLGDYSFELSYDLMTPRLVGNVLSKTNQGLNLGLSRRFEKPGIQVSVEVSDIFNSRNNNLVSYWVFQEIDQRSTYQSRRISLSVFYQLAYGKRFKSRNVRSSNLKEKARL